MVKTMGLNVLLICAIAIIYLIYNCVQYQQAAKHVMVITEKKDKDE